MESKINFKFAGTFLVIAIFLVSMAFLTITVSFAIDYSSESQKFDIVFNNINSNTIDIESISLRKNNIMFNIDLSKENNVNSFIFDIENKGTIDAYINNIRMSKLDDDLFEYNGINYKLSDFIVYNVYYAANNQDNKVLVNGDLKEKDELRKQTTNQVVVKVRLKESRELNQEKREALDYYLSTNNINKTLWLDASFSEL